MTNNVFFLKDSGRYIPINVSKLRWIVTEGNDCTLMLDNDESYTVRTSLASLLKSLSKSSITFVQSHRNFIINCNKITIYDPSGSVIIAGENIPVSKHYKKSLENALKFLID